MLKKTFKNKKDYKNLLNIFKTKNKLWLIFLLNLELNKIRSFKKKIQVKVQKINMNKLIKSKIII
jgi:hypothetical protein